MVKFRSALLILLIPVCSIAQIFHPEADWRFQNFNSQNHFISKFVADLTVDSSGYVWACSRGVNKFDGFRNIEYNSFGEAKGGLKSNYTAEIAVDKYGKVWVSAGGLCYYDNKTGNFNYIQPGAKREITYAYGFTFQKNYLWFVCDYGLAKVNLQTFKITFTSIRAITDPIESCLTNDTTLWITTRVKLYKYSINKNTYSAETYIHNSALLKIVSVEKGNNCFFLSTNAGLMMLKDGNAVPQSIKGLENLAINHLKFLPGDIEKKYLLIATNGKGLLVFNTISKKIEFTYVHDDDNPYSLPSNVITRIYTGKKGTLWLATALGISVLDINNQQWKMRFIKKSNTDNLDIHKITQDKYNSEKVWMLCDNVGLIRIDWRKKQIEKTFGYVFKDKKIIDFLQVDKKMWLLLNNNKLFEWDATRGIVHTNTKLPIADSVALSISLRRIIQVSPQDYLIATSRGLLEYNIDTHKMSAIKIQSDGSDPRSGYDLIDGFYENNVAWIASRHGLFKYDVNNKKIQIYTGHEKDDYFFYGIAKTSSGQLACGAINGLAIFDQKTSTFQLVHSIAKVIKPACLAIAATGNKLWLSTDAGTLSYDLQTKKSERVGLETPFIEIFASSPMAHIGNSIVMGFRNGYAYFDPFSKNNSTPSNPVIENLYVNNQPVAFQPSENNSSANLVFDHDSNSINIYFTSFLFSNPDNVNFRYRLVGADKNWHTGFDQRNANYTQLPSGHYTFYVQSGDVNRVWNSHLASLNFTISPPYWQTWWFRVFVLLLVTAILYRIYLYRIMNLKIIENIRDGIAKDFHDDLGSTLSSISIYSDVALKKADSDIALTKTMVEDMGMRARSMIQSMNDMVWTIKPENDTLHHLMQRMEEFSYPVAEAKDIQLVCLMDESSSDLKINMLKRKSLFLIFKEAFNNSVKYSDAKKIEVLFTIEQRKLLVMRVTDNGQGFNLAAKTGGNGLVNMQKRAKEIQGNIKIFTSPGEGTTILINCKIT